MTDFRKAFRNWYTGGFNDNSGSHYSWFAFYTSIGQNTYQTLMADLESIYAITRPMVFESLV